jgi:sugar lactone lactonase YvrE
MISAQAQPVQTEFRPIAQSLHDASSLSVTPTGHIYITESERHRLLVLSPEGVRLDSLGARGSGDYRFNKPVSVDATNGLKIYVADQNNSRVQLFDRRFQYLSTISADKVDGINRLSPNQIQVSNSGDLFVYDSDRHIIYVFDPFGNYSRDIDLKSFQIGSSIHMKIAGSVLLMLDIDAGLIHKFTADGGYLNFIGGFDGANRIHGTESDIWALYTNRIAMFTPVGELLQSYNLSKSVNPKDIYTQQSTVYILTDNQLLKTDVE